MIPITHLVIDYLTIIVDNCIYHAQNLIFNVITNVIQVLLNYYLEMLIDYERLTIEGYIHDEVLNNMLND